MGVMKTTLATVGRGTAKREEPSETLVALIAGDDGPCDSILAALEDQRLSFVLLGDIDELDSTDGDSAPTVLLLRSQACGASLAREVEPLCQRAELPPLVVVCPALQRRQVRSVLAAGVSGVILENELARALGPCLRAVEAGQVCVPRTHWAEIEPPALSAREKQILGLVVMGHMNSQIAERLFLAESTVKSHLSSAFDKLGVRSRNEAVELILDPGRGLGMGILALGGERLEPARPESA